jgi:hypothetical protein
VQTFGHIIAPRHAGRRKACLPLPNYREALR